MPKGRKYGQTEVTIDEIESIVNLTNEGYFRKEIAQKVGRSTHTVWRYQKKFGLV